MQINIEKRHLGILAILIIIFAGIFVYAYTSVPNPGHGASSVVVTVNGSEMTLQQAIDQNKIGGGGISLNDLIWCHDNRGYWLKDLTLTDSIPTSKVGESFIRFDAYGSVKKENGKIYLRLWFIDRPNSNNLCGNYDSGWVERTDTSSLFSVSYYKNNYATYGNNMWDCRGKVSFICDGMMLQSGTSSLYNSLTKYWGIK